MKPPHILVIGIAMAAFTAGTGCTARHLYATGQAWQQNACGRMIDQQDRERCLANANTPYETYSRQSGTEGESK